MLGTHAGAVMVHQARLFVQLRHPSRVELRAGRFHTPLGYYTTNYPHGGSVYRLTMERPRLLSMEMGEELVPNHLLGITASAGNGGPISFQAAYGIDHRYIATDHTHLPEAVVARISAAPRGVLEGVEVGLSGYTNLIAPDELSAGHANHTSGGDAPGAGTTTTDGTAMHEHAEMDGSTKVRETIGVAYATFIRWPVHAIAEAFYIHHRPVGGGAGHGSLAGFAQVGWHVAGHVTPYARYERLRRDPKDAVFEALAAPDALSQITLGVRLDLHEHLVLRAEGRYDYVQRLPSAGIQAAFGL